MGYHLWSSGSIFVLKKSLLPVLRVAAAFEQNVIIIYQWIHGILRLSVHT